MGLFNKETFLDVRSSQPNKAIDADEGFGVKRTFAADFAKLHRIQNQVLKLLLGRLWE